MDDDLLDDYGCESHFIEMTICSCKNEGNEHEFECELCNNFDECLEEAEDIADANAAFEDLILGSGYDSMDDFWESNI